MHWAADYMMRPAKKAGREVAQRGMRLLNRRQNPIVLMHGFMGFAHLGPIEYFMGVKESLEVIGFTVQTPTVDPINTHEHNGYEWFYARSPGTDDLDEMDTLYRHQPHLRLRVGRRTPHIAEVFLRHRKKIHLIAHSQACVGVRFLTSPQGFGNVKPFDDERFPAEVRDLRIADTIASVTTISGPHNGVMIADDTHAVTGFVKKGVFPVVNTVMGLIGGGRSDIWPSAREFGREYMLGTFNQTYEDHPDIDYYSIVGVTNEFQVNTILRYFYDETRFNPKFEMEDNDGFVPISSAKWPVVDGEPPPRESVLTMKRALAEAITCDERFPTNGKWKCLGYVYADHIHQIGMPFSTPRNPIFHHLEFYKGLARFLAGEFDDDVFLLPNGKWRAKSHEDVERHLTALRYDTEAADLNRSQT